MFKHSCLSSIIALALLATYASAGDINEQDAVPDAVGEAIELHYPGAEINDTEFELWKGRSAWEVELTTDDGDEIDVFVSDMGEILSESQGVPLIGGELAVGLRMSVEQSPYRGVGDKVEVLPLIHYRQGPFQITTEDGLVFSYDLLVKDEFTCGPIAVLSTGDGFEVDDSSYLEGMDEPDSIAMNAGVFCIYENSIAEFELMFLNGTTGHTGQEFELSIGHTWELEHFEIEPSVTIEYQSSSATDYFYGVSRSESRPGRRYYKPGSAINFSVGLMAEYELTPKIDLVGMVEYTWLDSSISNSSIVDRDSIVEVFFGVMYSF